MLTICVQAARSPEEEGDYLVFEQLVAEAAIKKDKNEDEKKKKEKKEHHRHSHHSHGDKKDTKESV